MRSENLQGDEYMESSIGDIEGAGFVRQISSEDKSEFCSQKLNIFQIWIKCDNRVLSTRDDS